MSYYFSTSHCWSLCAYGRVKIHMKNTAAIRDIRSTTILKGIAICGVLYLHIISSIPNLYQHLALWTIISDQIARFCVPLFVALSGYVLAVKYRDLENLWTFFVRRVTKLFPSYLLWSAIFIIATLIYSNLDDAQRVMPLWRKIFLGKSDYHLYFVPMIVQLYMLFPFLQWMMKRKATVTLFFLMLVQVGAFLLLTPLILGKYISTESIVDQNHYGISLFWIFYFGLGMWIADMQHAKKSIKRFVPLFVLLLVGGLSLTVTDAISGVHTGSNTITALRFTRFPLALYATGLIGVVMNYRLVFLAFPGFIVGLLEWMGEYSYLIYLSHTLLLRVLFSLWYKSQTLMSALPALLLFVGGTIGGQVAHFKRGTGK
jgi:probable poly-beta-1,6-N-acetyl-D-glucosamine export protein